MFGVSSRIIAWTHVRYQLVITLLRSVTLLEVFDSIGYTSIFNIHKTLFYASASIHAVLLEGTTDVTLMFVEQYFINVHTGSPVSSKPPPLRECQSSQEEG